MSPSRHSVGHFGGGSGCCTTKADEDHRRDDAVLDLVRLGFKAESIQTATGVTVKVMYAVLTLTCMARFEPVVNM